MRFKCRFQKKILNFVYGPVPETSYSEALGYFLKAEDAKPRSLLPNLYMLGRNVFRCAFLFLFHLKGVFV